MDLDKLLTEAHVAADLGEDEYKAAHFKEYWKFLTKAPNLEGALLKCPQCGLQATLVTLNTSISHLHCPLDDSILEVVE